MTTSNTHPAQGSPVDLQMTPAGAPTPSSALLRVVTSIPAILLVVVLSLAASVAWIVGAVSILLNQRMPGTAADFLTMTLRVQFRLIAYHLSIVDRYPSLEQPTFEPAAA